MNMQTEEILNSMHLWLNKQLDSVRQARNKTPESKPQQKAMLAGKVKAYTDAICFIQDKWGAKLEHLPLPTREKE